MKFKRLREQLGLSQLQMAVRAEVSIGTIQAFEAGTLRPSLRTRGKLAVAYGVEPTAIPPALKRPVSREFRSDRKAKVPA